MARWHGLVGFVTTVDKGYGVYEPESVSRPYFGDVIVNVRRLNDKTDSTNKDLVLNNQISIVADDFAVENMGFIRWVEYMGARWSVTAATINFPRIELSFGSVYAGDDDYD